MKVLKLNLLTLVLTLILSNINTQQIFENDDVFQNLIKGETQSALHISQYLSDSKIQMYKENRKIFNSEDKNVISINLHTKTNTHDFTLNSIINSHPVVDYRIPKIIKNGKEMNHTNFDINYHFSNNLLMLNTPITAGNSNKDIILNLTQPDIKLSFNSLNKPLNITYAISLDNLIMGLDSGSLKVFIFSFEKLNNVREEYVDEIFKGVKFSENKIKYILQDKNEGYLKRYILIEDFDSNLYLFSHTKGNSFDLIPADHFVNQYKEDKITSFVYRQNRIIYSYSNKGIVMVNLKDTSKVVSVTSYVNPLNKETENLEEVEDLQEIGDELIVMMRNRGLNSLNVSDLTNNLLEFSDMNFAYPGIKKINKIHTDSFSFRENNYTKQGMLLGVLVDLVDNNNNSGDEFYYEVFVNKTDKFIYRVYLTNKTETESQFETIKDSGLYTYLYDHKSSSVVLIVKSFAGVSPSSVFKYKLPPNNIVLDIVNFEDEEGKYKYIGFITADNFIFFNCEPQMTEPNLNIKTNSPGKYEIGLYTYIDRCPENNDYIQYRNCRQDIIYNLTFETGTASIDEFYLLVVSLWVFMWVFMIFIWINNSRGKKKITTVDSFDNFTTEGLEPNMPNIKLTSTTDLLPD